MRGEPTCADMHYEDGTVEHVSIRRVGWSAPWQMEPHVVAHLNKCDGCMAPIHQHAKPTYTIEPIS